MDDAPRMPARGEELLKPVGAAAAAQLKKPALTLEESIGYLQDRLNTWSDDLDALIDQT